MERGPKESYEDYLRRIIEKYGQFHTIYRTKFGVVEGYKKAEALVDVQPSPLDKVPRFVPIEVDTLEEHLELCRILAPVRLRGSELKRYANKRAQEYLKLGVEPGKIVSLLSGICHTSISYISRILPNEFKDESHQRKFAEQSSARSDKQAQLISKLRSKYDWLTTEDVLKGLKDPLFLLERAEAHLTSLALSKAEPSALIEVLYGRLEKESFPKLDDQSMLFWKFLAEEYQKRFES
jgi:hypothetical protein